MKLQLGQLKMRYFYWRNLYEAARETTVRDESTPLYSCGSLDLPVWFRDLANEIRIRIYLLLATYV